MDTLRYGLAFLLLVFLPPAILYWFVVHPFAAFWRRVGGTWGIVAGCAALAASAFALAAVAPQWLAREYGFSLPLTVLGVALFVTALWIQVRRRKYLTFRVLMGVPELSNEPGASRLFTEGIYARMRHPRYVEVLLATAGYALVANYLAGYVVIAASVPLLYLLVWIEERELAARFGAEWSAYAARTPRFLPRRAPR